MALYLEVQIKIKIHNNLEYGYGFICLDSELKLKFYKCMKFIFGKLNVEFCWLLEEK